MRVLVAYASKYGSTKGIAEFIAQKLQLHQMEAETKEVNTVQDLANYDAFVIGSAVFMGKWMKEAMEFVLRNRDTLSSRPIWLFSSGPLVRLDKQGRDTREGALFSKETEQLMAAIHPRDHRVFFGALNVEKLSFAHKMARKIPAARDVMPEGDFRDWNEIEVWTEVIAGALSRPAQVSTSR